MKKYKMTIAGEKFEAKIVEYTETRVILDLNGKTYSVDVEHEEGVKAPKLIRAQKSVPNAVSIPKKKTSIAAAGAVTSPLPGVVKQILVKEGDSVSEGDTVLILEAMKMESEIASTATGIVKKIHISDGASVQEGEVLVEIGD